MSKIYNLTVIRSLALVWCFSGAVTYAVQTVKCSEGTYLHQSENTHLCLLCPQGTFMPWKDHTAKECFECTKVEDPNIEILIRPCDRLRDADVQCVDGYFRRLARNPRDKPSCRKCTPACPDLFFQVHPCKNFTDIGCCVGENYDYYINEVGIRMCRERPWMCRKGQYLDTHVNDCKPCPENTFMSEDYHSHTKCWNCQYISDANLPLHTIIIQPCTSIQSPRYGCEAGYYVNHGMSYRGDDVGCSPCKTCDEGNYVGRHCNMYQDTLCCGKPNMTVVDGQNGEECVESQDCATGTYNPPGCDKNCSQHCRMNKRSDVSPCDYSNGTCLFGCLEGYTGVTCHEKEARLVSEERANPSKYFASTIAVSVILALVIAGTGIICVLYRHRGRRVCFPEWVRARS